MQLLSLTGAVSAGRNRDGKKKKQIEATCLCEQHDWETGPDLVRESSELVPGGLAAWVKIEDELWVEGGVWVDGWGEDVVWEGCNEGGECGKLFRLGEHERGTRRVDGLEVVGHLAEWWWALAGRRLVGNVTGAVAVRNVSEERP